MNEPPSREAVLLGEALALPAGQRADYLDHACGANTDLRRAVQVLLDAHDEAGAFLESAATGGRLLAAAANPILAAAENSVPVQKPGDRIGRYKLLEQIGEGGCGVVFMAEQEEPVRRRVALKIIKLGMDTKEVIARFEAERQALAMMDHSNIAKVLDAGATETGRPYFVMELVRGIKITEYCDQNNLTTKERLDLFSQVCRAIQHAHQKGIIHRDVKPSNILVTLHDGVPVPKVIDFGIAKATQGRLTDQTLFTAFQQFIGTPAYMSPEQAEMSGLDIDTRSDIYSLGVLLYELLTGKTPFDGKELLAAGVDAMRRTIREQEPQPPSTRLTQELVAADVRRLKSSASEDVATKEEIRASSRRLLRTKELITSIRGDLDWIVMKCLEKDRTRRYETANGLATDVQRHLSNEAVLACPPSNLYRLRKVIRRNKLAFAAGISVAAALAIGLGIATWMFFEQRITLGRALAAEHEQARLRQQAETESLKSKQVAKFLTDMLQGVSPSVALGRDTTLLNDILTKTADRIRTDLAGAPAVEAELLSTMATTYRALKEYPKAEEMYREALAIRKKQFGDEHQDVAQSLSDLAVVLGHEANYVESETLQREALVMRQKLFGNEHPAVCESLNHLAMALQNQGKSADTEALQRQSLAIANKVMSDNPRQRAEFMNNLGLILNAQGKTTQAEATYRQALALHISAGEDHVYAATCLQSLGGLLRRKGELDEAEVMLRDALRINTKLFSEEHPYVTSSLISLADLLTRKGELAESKVMARQALTQLRKRPVRRERSDLSFELLSLADAFADTGDFSEAENIMREALARRRSSLPATSDGVVSAAATLGRLLAEWAWSEWARNAAMQSGISTNVLTAEDGSRQSSTNTSSATADSRSPYERAREAETLLRDCWAIRSRTLTNHWRLGDAQSRLGFALLAVAMTDPALTPQARVSKLAEAETFLTQGNEILQQSSNAGSKYKRDALQWLVRLYETWDELDPNSGKASKAAAWKEKLVEFDNSKTKKNEIAEQSAQ